MQTQAANIYMSARLSAGITREKAAELLYTSVRSLADYELDVRVPPNDVVARMVDLYASPWLAIWHLRACVPIAQTVIPAVEEVSLPEAVLQLIAAADDLGADTSDLIQIARDGRVDDLEADRFEQILDRLQPLVAAALAVRCHRQIGG